MITAAELRARVEVCLRAGAERALHIDAGCEEVAWLQTQVRDRTVSRHRIVSDFFEIFPGDGHAYRYGIYKQVEHAYDLLAWQQIELLRWQTGQIPSIKDEFAANELIEYPRACGFDWREKWAALSGGVIDGKCVALKDHAIWKTFSDYGLPYPPFEWSGALHVRNLDIRESEKLGLRSWG